MGERGTIYVYGGLHQRRRGWVHLSGSDPLSHNDNEWDIEHWNYGGTHGPAGYAKDYHYDDRLLETSPIDYLKVSLENMSYNTFVNSSEISLYDYFSETGEVTVIATYTLPSNNFQLVDTCVDDEQYTFMLVENPAGQPQNYLLKYNDNEWELIEFDDNLINLVSIDPMNEFYVLKAGNELHLVNGEGIIQPGWIFTSYSILSDFTNTQGNNLHYISEQNFIYYYRVSEIMSQGMCNLLGEFEFSLDELAELLNPNFSLLYNSDGKIVMQIMDRDTQATFTYKNIYLATGDISGFFTSTPEDEITIITQLNIYPNPFNPLANISFGLAEPGFVEIDIYNLKGQKVKSLAQEYYDRGNFQIVWDASLNSSGVYFIEMTIDHELTYWGKLTLLK
ncbi:MAG: T9SS type A sorting domain-containing protein [Candidatus Cloacimonetes bacterium]|nr:T9SS type A sorting domain-containing protein [Candidatus Cloacimonadota bacterium]